MKKWWIHIAFLMILPGITVAQEIPPDKIIESIIESQADNVEGESDAAQLIEDLQDLLEHPVNLNATDAEELSKLYLLNSIQISNLLSYVKEFGPVYSLFELNSIDGFDPELLQKMQPFFFFGPMEQKVLTLKEQLGRNRQELLVRGLGNLQKARGYLPADDGPAPYEGNRFRYYARYRFSAGERVSAGITAEKDPGEAFFKGSNKVGFDYYSAHLSMNISKTFEQMTIGDFMVRSGQGLVLWQGFAPGKSSDVTGILKYGQGIRPYNSVDENLHLRGVAMGLNFGKTRLSIFYSDKKADANLVLDENGNESFTSLQTSGYHRTQSEMADKNSVKHQNAGSVITWNLKQLRIGASFVYQRFNIPFQPDDQLYNRFMFKGTANTTGGVDYLYSKGKYQFFGEAAISKSKGTAFLQGALAHLNDRLSVAALFRHFDKNYHALWGQAFAESSTVANETGFYLGAKFLSAKFVTLSAYSDFYRFPWISYSTAGPAQGHDLFLQSDVRFSDRLRFYIRYKSEEKDQKIKAQSLYKNQAEQTQKLRVHVDFVPNERWKFMTRLEWSGFRSDSAEVGFMVYQDMQFAPEKIPVKISARLSYFNTESYNSRIYAYENDLLYTFSVPAFYGQGFRTYLNIRYVLSERLDCWLKIANSLWTDRNTISSGYNEIDGRNKTEVKLQLRLKF